MPPLFNHADFKPVTVTTHAETIVRPSTTYWQDAWRRLKKHRLAVVGLIIIGILALMAIFGPLLSPYSYSDQSLDETNQPPSAKHWFGTDNLGRDLFTRVLYGARISLAIGFITSFISLGIGVTYGAISGFFGGRVDAFMMRIVDILYGLPFLLYVILLLVIMGPGLGPIFIALGIVYWLNMARIVRGEILSLKEREFVLAARTIGVSPKRIIMRHLVPNAMGPIIVTMTLVIPEAIFSEAFLSYIGLGVSAPVASWGVLASDGYTAIRTYPWQLFFPAAFISITMLAFNFLGDGLRDALDPRMRR
ncbi:MAG: ABC transporter permease [Peptococcaceae bacterium]|nr:ABC transporter permease [Peptococcaceae bacterium]